MEKKNYGKSVKTRLLNLMNETGYNICIFLQATAVQGICKSVQGQLSA